MLLSKFYPFLEVFEFAIVDVDEREKKRKSFLCVLRLGSKRRPVRYSTCPQFLPPRAFEFLTKYTFLTLRKSGTDKTRKRVPSWELTVFYSAA